MIEARVIMIVVWLMVIPAVWIAIRSDVRIPRKKEKVESDE